MGGTVERERNPGTTVRTILGSAQVWRSGAPWLVGLLLVANVGIAKLERQFEENRRAGLLVPTAPVGAGEKPQFDLSVGERLEDFWGDIPDAREQPLVILSGMSQMHAINDRQPGDKYIVQILDDDLRPHGVRAFGLAAPNLDNEEALLYLLATASDPRTKPRVFIYGLCFDKFRNVDVRPNLQRFMRSHEPVLSAWRGVCDGRGPEYAHACDAIRATLAQVNAPEASAASGGEGLEGDLRDALGRAIPMIAARENLNAAFQAELYDFRNWALGIHAYTKRPIIADRYTRNAELLALMAAVAKEAGILFVTYIIPLNPQAETPYVAEQYAAFKTWAARFASDRGLPFANFEDVVPAEGWGIGAQGGPDYKHFREEGHRLTAAAIFRTFGPVLLSEGRGATP